MFAVPILKCKDKGEAENMSSIATYEELISKI